MTSHASDEAMEASQSLARRRHRLSQAMVRNFLRVADSMPMIPMALTGFMPLPTMGFGLVACLACRCG